MARGYVNYAKRNSVNTLKLSSSSRVTYGYLSDSKAFHAWGPAMRKIRMLLSIEDQGQTDRVTSLTRVGLRATPHASPR